MALRDYNEPFFGQVAPGARRELIAPGVQTPGSPAFQMVQERPFDGMECYAFVVGVNPIRLDNPQILLKNRRAVLIVNSHLANSIWIGHHQGVAVNNGQFLAAQSSYAGPLSDKIALWVVSSGAGSVISITQYA